MTLVRKNCNENDDDFEGSKIDFFKKIRATSFPPKQADEGKRRQSLFCFVAMDSWKGDSSQTGLITSPPFPVPVMRPSALASVRSCRREEDMKRHGRIFLFRRLPRTNNVVIPWSTLIEGNEQPATLVSYSVHEGKHFLFQVWVDYFLRWFTMEPVQLFISCYLSSQWVILLGNYQGAVVVAQVVEQLIQKPRIWSLNPVIGNFQKWANPTSFSFIFKQTIQFWQQSNAKNVYGVGIQTHDLSNMSYLQ